MNQPAPAEAAAPAREPDPTVAEMLKGLTGEIRILSGLSIRDAADDAKCRRYRRQIHRLEGVKQIIESVQTYMGIERTPAQVHLAIKALLKHPAPTAELLHAMAGHEMFVTTVDAHDRVEAMNKELAS